MRYIQRRDNSTGQLETVDEFETTSEARAMLREYQLGDRSATFYTSSRACRDWREARKEDKAGGK